MNQSEITKLINFQLESRENKYACLKFFFIEIWIYLVLISKESNAGAERFCKTMAPQEKGANVA